jgi:hypothetical protein
MNGLSGGWPLPRRETRPLVVWIARQNNEGAPLLEKREKWGTPPFSGSSIENHQSKIINPPYTCSLASPKVTVTSIFFFPR